MIRNLIILTTCFTAIYGECGVISRVEWGAVRGVLTPLRVHQPGHVVIHHSSTPTCTDFVNCAALVRSIQKNHMRKGYQDIGYNFLVGEDGNVYEGAGWGNEGNHDYRLNSRSIGICIIGEYTSRIPNEKALSALYSFLDCAENQRRIAFRYKLLTHRQLNNTDCPGNKILNHLRQWERWSPHI